MEFKSFIDGITGKIKFTLYQRNLASHIYDDPIIAPLDPFNAETSKHIGNSTGLGSSIPRSSQNSVQKSPITDSKINS